MRSLLIFRSVSLSKIMISRPQGCFPLLELRGFDGVVNDNVDDNSIWIEYISAICFFLAK
jgi:hypothetical protein